MTKVAMKVPTGRDAQRIRLAWNGLRECVRIGLGCHGWPKPTPGELDELIEGCRQGLVALQSTEVEAGSHLGKHVEELARELDRMIGELERAKSEPPAPPA